MAAKKKRVAKRYRNDAPPYRREVGPPSRRVDQKTYKRPSKAVQNAYSRKLDQAKINRHNCTGIC